MVGRAVTASVSTHKGVLCGVDSGADKSGFVLPGLRCACSLGKVSHKGFGCGVVGAADVSGIGLDRSVFENGYLHLVHRIISG
jgi:hypothetical protein